MGSLARGCPRCGELEETIERLREANRRLQVQGPAIERDKLIEDLRAALALQVQELGKLTSDLARLADRATDNNEHEISAIYASCFMKITQLLPSAAAPVKENSK